MLEFFGQPQARLCAVASLLLFIVGCGGASKSVEDGDDGSVLRGKLVLTGSSTVAPLVAEIGKRFESLHPDVRVDVQTGGSSRGIADTESGVADIGMSSRALEADEAAVLTSHPIAFDGVAFLVHAANPVTSPSDEQFLAIYRGEMDNWRELGGEDLPITVVNRAEGRSEVELVTSYFEIESRDIAADLIAGENQQGIKTVAGDPSAIVYMSIGASQRDIEAGVSIKLLPLRDVPATAENVAAGRFPLARPLVLLSRKHPSVLVSAFITYAQSAAVEDLIADLSYVAPRYDATP